MGERETDVADGAFVSELGEELKHFGGDGLVAVVSNVTVVLVSEVVGLLTRLAGVRVSSTSKRQMVFLRLRWSSGGYTAAASVGTLEGTVAIMEPIIGILLLSSIVTMGKGHVVVSVQSCLLLARKVDLW